MTAETSEASVKDTDATNMESPEIEKEEPPKNLERMWKLLKNSKYCSVQYLLRNHGVKKFRR